MIARFVVAAFAVLGLLAGMAVAEPPQMPPLPFGFDDAFAKVADDPRGAVQALLAIAALNDPSAPDALFSAARITDDDLHDPAAALALYREVLASYPDSRAAVGAGRRVEAIQAVIGESPANLQLATAWARLRNETDEQPLSAQQTSEAMALFSAEWPGAAQVGLWFAARDERAGRLGDAMRWLGEIRRRFAGSELAVEATRNAAELALRLHDFSLAAALAHELPTTTASDQALVSELRSEVHRAEQRMLARNLGLGVAVVAMLVLLTSLVHAAGRPANILRALRPPFEVWYLAPVLGVFALAAATGFVGIGRAVAWISSAGLAATWLSGAGLEAARTRGLQSRWRPILHAVLTPAVVLGVAVVVLLRDDLAQLVLETLRAGPDR